MEPDALAGGGRAPDLDDDTHEIEHGGVFYRIPNALRGAFQSGADLRRVAEELESRHGDLQAWRDHLDAEHASLQDGLDLRVALHAADAQLAEFEDVDWETFLEEDPDSAQAVWRQYEALAHARERYAWALGHHQQEAARQAEAELEARLNEAGRVLAREIDGWSPEVAAKLVEYAGAFGVTLDELREIADPRLWKILHRAHQGDELLKSQETEQSITRAQALRPALSVASASTGGGVRDDLAADEWMQRRNTLTRRSR